jgi:stage II sporulation protein D
MSTRRTTPAVAISAAPAVVPALVPAVVLAVLLAVSATGQRAAAATSTAALLVPHRAVITIDGRGWGHGHGLSQYGAEGAARKGRSARQILHFYYPHTHAAGARGRVRVLVTADTDGNTTVITRSGLRVRDLAEGSTTALPTSGAVGHATRWRLSAGSGGTTRVSYLTGAWHLWRRLDGDGEFRASGPIRLVVGSQNVTYRGTLQSRTPPIGPAGDRVTVNKVALDGYVRGVIPREMPASWHRAALRAQAVAARTYASFEERSSTNPVWQLCDTSACQVYGGRSAESPSTNAAVASTAGRILTHGGLPAFTQFSASNGGWTADGGEPYLVAKPDPYDGWPGNLVHAWTTSVTSRSIERAWPALGDLRSIRVTGRDGNGRWGGRVLSLTLRGSTGNVRDLSGDTFRALLGLRSTWFDLAKASAG